MGMAEVVAVVTVVVLLLVPSVSGKRHGGEVRPKLLGRGALPGRAPRHQTRRALMLLQNASDRPVMEKGLRPVSLTSGHF